MIYNIKLHFLRSLDDNFLIGIRAKIFNTKGFFIIDTGAQLSIINQQLINKYQLNYNTLSLPGSEIVGINKEAIQEIKFISNINFYHQKKRFKLLNIIIFDLSHIENKFKKNYTILGILGNDVFLQYQALINYKEKMLTFNIK